MMNGDICDFSQDKIHPHLKEQQASPFSSASSSRSTTSRDLYKNFKSLSMIPPSYALPPVSETYTAKALHLYKPTNKSEVRLVYRVLNFTKNSSIASRHQKTYSFNDYGETIAWHLAKQAFFYMNTTGKLPPDFSDTFTSPQRILNPSLEIIENAPRQQAVDKLVPTVATDDKFCCYSHKPTNPTTTNSYRHSVDTSQSAVSSANTNTQEHQVMPHQHEIRKEGVSSRQMCAPSNTQSPNIIRFTVPSCLLSKTGPVPLRLNSNVQSSHRSRLQPQPEQYKSTYRVSSCCIPVPYGGPRTMRSRRSSIEERPFESVGHNPPTECLLDPSSVIEARSPSLLVQCSSISTSTLSSPSSVIDLENETNKINHDNRRNNEANNETARTTTASSYSDNLHTLFSSQFAEPAATNNETARTTTANSSSDHLHTLFSSQFAESALSLDVHRKQEPSTDDEKQLAIKLATKDPKNEKIAGGDSGEPQRHTATIQPQIQEAKNRVRRLTLVTEEIRASGERRQPTAPEGAEPTIILTTAPTVATTAPTPTAAAAAATSSTPEAEQQHQDEISHITPTTEKRVGRPSSKRKFCSTEETGRENKRKTHKRGKRITENDNSSDDGILPEMCTDNCNSRTKSASKRFAERKEAIKSQSNNQNRPAPLSRELVSAAIDNNDDDKDDSSNPYRRCYSKSSKKRSDNIVFSPRSPFKSSMISDFVESRDLKKYSAVFNNFCSTYLGVDPDVRQHDASRKHLSDTSGSGNSPSTRSENNEIPVPPVRARFRTWLASRSPYGSAQRKKNCSNNDSETWVQPPLTRSRAKRKLAEGRRENSSQSFGVIQKKENQLKHSNQDFNRGPTDRRHGDEISTSLIAHTLTNDDRLYLCNLLAKASEESVKEKSSRRKQKIVYGGLWEIDNFWCTSDASPTNEHEFCNDSKWFADNENMSTITASTKTLQDKALRFRLASELGDISFGRLPLNDKSECIINDNTSASYKRQLDNSDDALQVFMQYLDAHLFAKARLEAAAIPSSIVKLDSQKEMFPEKYNIGSRLTKNRSWPPVAHEKKDEKIECFNYQIVNRARSPLSTVSPAQPADTTIDMDSPLSVDVQECAKRNHKQGRRSTRNETNTEVEQTQGTTPTEKPNKQSVFLSNDFPGKYLKSVLSSILLDELIEGTTKKISKMRQQEDESVRGVGSKKIRRNGQIATAGNQQKAYNGKGKTGKETAGRLDERHKVHKSVDNNKGKETELDVKENPANTSSVEHSSITDDFHRLAKQMCRIELSEDELHRLLSTNHPDSKISSSKNELQQNQNNRGPVYQNRNAQFHQSCTSCLPSKQQQTLICPSPLPLPQHTKTLLTSEQTEQSASLESQPQPPINRRDLPYLGPQYRTTDHSSSFVTTSSQYSDRSSNSNFIDNGGATGKQSGNSDNLADSVSRPKPTVDYAFLPSESSSIFCNSPLEQVEHHQNRLQQQNRNLPLQLNQVVKQEPTQEQQEQTQEQQQQTQENKQQGEQEKAQEKQQALLQRLAQHKQKQHEQLQILDQQNQQHQQSLPPLQRFWQQQQQQQQQQQEQPGYSRNRSYDPTTRKSVNDECKGGPVTQQKQPNRCYCPYRYPPEGPLPPTTNQSNRHQEMLKNATFLGVKRHLWKVPSHWNNAHHPERNVIGGIERLATDNSCQAIENYSGFKERNVTESDNSDRVNLVLATSRGSFLKLADSSLVDNEKKCEEIPAENIFPHRTRGYEPIYRKDEYLHNVEQPPKKKLKIDEIISVGKQQEQKTEIRQQLKVSGSSCRLYPTSPSPSSSQPPSSSSILDTQNLNYSLFHEKSSGVSVSPAVCAPQRGESFELAPTHCYSQLGYHHPSDPRYYSFPMIQQTAAIPRTIIGSNFSKSSLLIDTAGQATVPPSAKNVSVKLRQRPKNRRKEPRRDPRVAEMENTAGLDYDLRGSELFSIIRNGKCQNVVMSIEGSKSTSNNTDQQRRYTHQSIENHKTPRTIKQQ